MGMDLGPYYSTLAASDRLRILVEELRRLGSTREILRELGCLAEELEEVERSSATPKDPICRAQQRCTP